MLDRILSSTGRNTILSSDLPFYPTRNRRTLAGRNPESLKEVHGRPEKEAILYALRQTRNNKARAAQMLNINRMLLYKKMARH